MTNTLREKFIGDKAFYAMVLTIAVPIIVQNGITNFVNLLDNLMVGQLGTEEMSGVAIVNQLIMVYNLCIFGAVSGAGLFTAQFFGKNDTEGVRYTLRFKLIIVTVITILVSILFLFKGKDLIRMYLEGQSDGCDPQLALTCGWEYLLFMLPGFFAFMLEQAYAGTLRECGETVLPMKAGIVAVCINVIFNYLLIYGKFGFPQMGVQGAAIATSMARFVEAAIVIIWAHRNTKQFPFVKGLYKTLYIPWHLTAKIIKTGTPLLFNETLWSAGMAMLSQCYSLRGLNVIAGFNITTTLFNLFNVVIFAIGTSIAIIVGQRLGANQLEEARNIDNKLLAFSVFCGIGIGLLMAASAPFFPMLYNTSEAARDVATGLMLLQAVFYPQFAFINAAYFTMRSGGKTVVTFLFDSVFVWVVCVPVAFVCSRFTGWSIFVIFILVNIADWIKCIVATILLKKGIWIHNIVDKSY